MAYCETTVGLNYFRLSADRRLLFGGICNYSGRDPKSITGSLRPRLLRIFPQLDDVGIDYEWGGQIAITRSYYAATRKYKNEYPTLQGEHRCDVVVVGGGFTGVSAALHLAERGYDVALLEANRISWGASGRNGGQLIDGFTSADKMKKRFGDAAGEMVQQMAFESRDIVVQRIEKYSIDCNLRFGFIDVAQNDADMRDFDDAMARKKAAGYPHKLQIIPHSEMRDYLVSDHYMGGFLDYGNGQLHPLNLCAGEAQAASELGAKIFEQSRVIEISHGERPFVTTESGTVFAGKIVLAGNAYLTGSEAKIRNKIIPAKSFIIATEALGESRAAELLPQDSVL
jgi:glycine/D-amino acid oxidase-like deaminating enzyme